MTGNLTYSESNARRQTELLRETLSELPIACREFIRAIEPTTTALTRLAYGRDLRLFFKFLGDEMKAFGGFSAEGWTYELLGRIKAADIDAFLGYLTLYFNEDNAEFTNAELGKQRKLSTLRSFFKFLFKRGFISADASALVDMPKRHEKPILRLEIDEVARILDLAESGAALSERQKKFHEHTSLRDLAMLTLFLGTGIRVSECVGLDVNDLDFEINGFLVTRKGGNQAILYFPDEVADVLKRYLEERRLKTPLPGHENALFLSLQDRRITTRAIQNMVKKYALQAAPLKKRMSPHKLRSTFGTNLYRETGDIYLVADVLGHSDVNTTRRHYAAMSDDRRRLAAKKVVLREDKKPGNDQGQDN
jgi:site-specific recombinase XerD